MIRSWWAAEKSNSEPVPGLAEAILVFGIWVPLLGADEKSEVLQGVHRMTMYIRVYIYIHISYVMLLVFYFACHHHCYYDYSITCSCVSLLIIIIITIIIPHPSVLIPQSSSSSSSPSLSSWWLFSDMIGCWWPHVVCRPSIQPHNDHSQEPFHGETSWYQDGL